jgi:hypothetical protein
MAYILFDIKFYYAPMNFGLKCCPPNQFFVQLFGHCICPIYIFSFICHHHGDNIFVTKVVDFIPFVNNLNEFRKMNIIRWFHYTNTRLFYINVNSRQSNVLKHNFCSLLFNLFLLFPTNVWYLKHNNDDIFIHNNYLLPCLNINCVLVLNSLTIEKIHQQIMTWCLPLTFEHTYQSNHGCPSFFYLSHFHLSSDSFQLLSIQLLCRGKSQFV